MYATISVFLVLQVLFVNVDQSAVNGAPLEAVTESFSNVSYSFQNDQKIVNDTTLSDTNSKHRGVNFEYSVTISSVHLVQDHSLYNWSNHDEIIFFTVS